MKNGCSKNQLLLPEGMFNYIYKGLDPKKGVFIQRKKIDSCQ